MRLTEVTLVTRDLEPGWSLIEDDVPLGQKYVVDMDRIEGATVTNSDTGRSKQVACIYVVEPHKGWLPAMVFGFADLAPTPGVKFDTLGVVFVANVCRLGKRSRCCSYLCQQGPADYFCAKGTPYEGSITKKRRMGQMMAQGDNCSGPPHFITQGVTHAREH